jgi:hypothetical protein
MDLDRDRAFPIWWSEKESEEEIITWEAEEK